MTPKVVLTDKYLKTLKPAPKGKRPIVWDAVQPNFGIRITDRAISDGQYKNRAASISFVVVRRLPGDRNPVNHLIGAYNRDAGTGNPGSLAHARAEARAVLATISQGIHPRDAEEVKQREDARRRNDTVLTVAEEFIKRHISERRRDARAAEALIRREILGQRQVRKIDNGKPVIEWKSQKDARWRDRPITSITRRDAIEIIDGVTDRSGRHSARKVYATISKMFNWALVRDTYGLETSPLAYVKVADIFGKPLARDRVLSDDELRHVWFGAEGMMYPFGTLIKVLMLTGQRLREISDAQWSEIENGTLTVPAGRMKGKIAHSVPLTATALALIETAPRFDGAGFIFTTTGGRRPVSGFSKTKKRLDDAISKRRDGTPLAPWTIHDIRRTVRTRLSGLRVLPLVAELVIAHRQSGIQPVYDLHKYDSEKLAALAEWEKALLSIVAQLPEPAANVTDLNAEKAKRQRV